MSQPVTAEAASGDAERHNAPTGLAIVGTVGMDIAAGDPPSREFAIHSLQLGYSLSAPADPGGAGAVRFTELTFLKVVDFASPQLLEKTSEGHVFPGVTIGLFRPGTTDISIRYRLSDARITEVRAGIADINGTHDGPQATENVSLNFEQIRVRYATIDGNVIERGWDLRNNTPV